jgi:sugar O-acyltransferase (sialic acid O-acetyltransferase NeuD family)
MTDLVIFGIGGFAREVHQLVEDLVSDGAAWNVVGFIGDQLGQIEQVHGLPVLGDRSWLRDRDIAVAIGVGSTPARRSIVNDLRRSSGVAFPRLVHPSAWIGNRISLGDGSIVCAGSLLTTDLVLQDFCIINIDCTLGHDSRVSDFVTVAPSVNISGAVSVGEGADLGTGATIIQGRAIGEWSIIGAGAVVVRDVPPNVTAVGVPASVIKERPSGWHLQ